MTAAFVVIANTEAGNMRSHDNMTLSDEAYRLQRHMREASWYQRT